MGSQEARAAPAPRDEPCSRKLLGCLMLNEQGGCGNDAGADRNTDTVNCEGQAAANRCGQLEQGRQPEATSWSLWLLPPARLRLRRNTDVSRGLVERVPLRGRDRPCRAIPLDGASEYIFERHRGRVAEHLLRVVDIRLRIAHLALPRVRAGRLDAAPDNVPHRVEQLSERDASASGNVDDVTPRPRR